MRAGKLRKVRRIQEVLDHHHMTFTDVARGLGVSSSLVSQAAHGVTNNRRVLRRFLELGVAPGDLDLPEDMRPEQNSKKRKVA